VSNGRGSERGQAERSRKHFGGNIGQWELRLVVDTVVIVDVMLLQAVLLFIIGEY
jgi:hypothetical protein